LWLGELPHPNKVASPEITTAHLPRTRETAR
jgi:hypothetical protein